MDNVSALVGGSRRWLAAAVASLTVVAAVAISVVINTETPDSWISDSTRTVALVQYARTDAALQGTIDVTSLQDGGIAAKTEHIGFSGTVSGGRVSLMIAQGFGLTSTLTGTLDRQRLTLAFPDESTGTLAPTVFRPGDVQTYNKLASRIRAKAASNRRAAEQVAAAQEAEAQRVLAEQAAEAELRGASDAVANDVGTIENALSVGVSFGNLDSDLASAKKSLGATKAASQKAKAGGDNACYEAGNAGYEAGNVGYYSSSIDYDAQAVQSAVDDLGRSLASLAGHYKALQDILATRGLVVDAANVSAVESAQRRVNSAVSSWSGQVASYKDQVKKLVDEARGVADAAQKAACG